MTKVIRVCFGFALQRLVIGLKNSRHFLNQSEDQNRSQLANAPFPAQHVIASSFDWFTGSSVPFVIGQSNYYDTQRLKTTQMYLTKEFRDFPGGGGGSLSVQVLTGVLVRAVVF